MNARPPAIAAPRLAEGILRHAGERPDAPAFRFLDRQGQARREITWSALHEAGSRVAAGLADAGLAGKRVAVICPEPADFVVALTGCLLAGSVAVPLPAVATRRSAERIAAIVDTAAPAALVGTEATLAEPWIAARLVSGDVVGLTLESLASRSAAGFRPASVEPAEPALIQFTSGSTATPRGVVLSHANIGANCVAIAEAYGLDAASVGFSWLPLHHDMGLVGHVLTTFLVGGCSVIMNPLYFLQSPLRWLKQAGEQRATITSAPNFGYALCVQAAAREGLAGIDLASLTAAVCGGEPVMADTVSAFCEAFAPAGFRRAAFSPSYGLAEATLLVSSGRLCDGPPQHTAARTAGVVSLGAASRGSAIRIIDGQGRDCADGEVGEIEVAGTSVGAVLGDPGARAGVVRTGDLGFLLDGDLYVTGRRKELIILRGQNVFPVDIEAAALGADPDLRPGGVAAVGISEGGTQALAVLLEVNQRRVDSDGLVALCRAVSESVTRASGFTPKRIVPVATGALPRTTSGKLQRNLIAAMLAAGELQPLMAETIVS